MRSKGFCLGKLFDRFDWLVLGLVKSYRRIFFPVI